MNFLYISPEFPPNYANFAYALQAAGARVWGMGEADFYGMPESLRAALPWYVRTDLHSPDRVIQALEQLQQAQARLGVAAGFDRVESHNEAWLRVEALINEKLGLDGLHPAEVDRIKLKSAMKAVFAASAASSSAWARAPGKMKPLPIRASWRACCGPKTYRPGSTSGAMTSIMTGPGGINR